MASGPRYNKVSRWLWSRPEIVSMGPPPISVHLLWVYLMTCDRPTCVAGLLKAGPGTISDETGWGADKVRKALDQLHEQGHIVRSSRPPIIWIEAATECDKPEGPKQVKGWEDALRSLPVCEATDAAKRSLGLLLDTVSDTVSDRVSDRVSIAGTGTGTGTGTGHNDMSAAPPAVDAPRPPVKESQRSKDAKELDQHWQDLSGARPKPNSAASKKRLARWARYLKDHSVEDLKLLTEYIADSAWWRGDNNTGSDLFKAGPGRFINDPEKVEARVEEARLWDQAGRPAQAAQSNPKQSNRPPWERTIEDVKAEVEANLRAKGIDPDALTH